MSKVKFDEVLNDDAKMDVLKKELETLKDSMLEMHIQQPIKPKRMSAYTTPFPK